jgi:hypothetical protein
MGRLDRDGIGTRVAKKLATLAPDEGVRGYISSLILTP